MNLAYIIDKTQYVKMIVRSVGTQRHNTEMSGMGGHVISYVTRPPTTTLECSFKRKDYIRFTEEVRLGNKSICECLFDGIMNNEEYLIEFIPTDIHYEIESDICGYINVTITCYEFSLLKIG